MPKYASNIILAVKGFPTVYHQVLQNQAIGSYPTVMKYMWIIERKKEKE
jgi:hypothetical protein